MALRRTEPVRPDRQRLRAPNYNEVNGAFRNSAQIYASSPNPDLKAETSLGVEIGPRAPTSATCAPS
jgi:hypothetical protein